MKIQTLKDAMENNGVKCFVYGRAGVGKTPLILTLPGHGLVVNAEAGLRSLKDRDAAGTFEIASVRTIKELSEVHDLLKSGKHNYEWVAIDSISEIAEVVISEEKFKAGKDPRKAYGGLIDRMAPILRDFRDLPLDIYMIGKSAQVKEEETGRITYEIMIPGSKVGQSIPYLFDELFYMLTVENKDGDEVAWLQTKSDRKVLCRDRSGRLNNFEPADLGAILRKIKASVSTVVTAPDVATETSSN